MEIALYLANFILTGWLLFWTVRNTERSGRSPITGLFRYRDPSARPPADRRR